MRGICHSRHGLLSFIFSSPTSTSPSPILPSTCSAPATLNSHPSHLGAQYLVVIAGGSLCRPKRVVIGPVAVTLWVVSPVALLTGPAIAHRAFPTHVVLMDAGHQGPAATPRGHVTEGLVDDTILSAEDIQAICRGNQPETPCLRAQGPSQTHNQKDSGKSEMYPEGSHTYPLVEDNSLWTLTAFVPCYLFKDFVERTS